MEVHKGTRKFGRMVLGALPWLIAMSLLPGCGGENAQESKSETVNETVAESESTGTISSGDESAESKVQEAEEKELPKEVSALFSGNEQDRVVMDEHGYVERERFIAYLEKGATLPGDLTARIEEIMRQEEQLLGLSYSVTDFAENADWRQHYFGDAFEAIPLRNDKVQIIIVTDKNDGSIEWSDCNEILLFDKDFFPEIASEEPVYHEMAHVLRLRQSEGLGQVLEEGIGTYAELRLSMSRNTACWSCIQYVRDETYRSTFDDSVIIEDPEGTFREFNVAERNGLEPEYQYGVRLISFLTEEYGEDVILRLSEAAAKREYSEKDNDVVIAILKEATSEDVFERFAKWLPEGWARISREIILFLENYGL